MNFEDLRECVVEVDQRLRLLSTKAYKNKRFGDISTVTDPDLNPLGNESVVEGESLLPAGLMIRYPGRLAVLLKTYDEEILGSKRFIVLSSNDVYRHAPDLFRELSVLTRGFEGRPDLTDFFNDVRMKIEGKPALINNIKAELYIGRAILTEAQLAEKAEAKANFYNDEEFGAF